MQRRNLIGDVRSPDAGPPLAFSLNGARSFRVAGEKPWVAVGDLNGDGKLDVAVANTGDLNGRAGGSVGGSTGNVSNSKVSVLLGRGDGTFDRSVDYDAGANVSAIALGDLDGDGALDVAVGGEPGVLLLLLGHGDGTFASPISPFETPLNPYPAMLPAALRSAMSTVTAASTSLGQRHVTLDFGAAQRGRRKLERPGRLLVITGGPVLGVALGDLTATANPTSRSPRRRRLSAPAARPERRMPARADRRRNSVESAGVLMNLGDGTFGPLASYQVGGCRLLTGGRRLRRRRQERPRRSPPPTGVALLPTMATGCSAPPAPSPAAPHRLRRGGRRERRWARRRRGRE